MNNDMQNRIRPEFCQAESGEVIDLAEARAKRAPQTDAEIINHFFRVKYPKKVRAQAAALLQFAQRVDYIARTGRPFQLDYIDVLTRDLLEKIAVYQEWSRRFIGRQL